jgi:subtilase family serine protease
LPALEGGESAGAKFTWTAQAGDHEFKAVVDQIDRVLETDESNNVKVFSYKATALADLVIDGLVWVPLAPSPDDDVTFTVTAVNVGKGRSQPFTVGVFLNDDARPMWRLRFPELRPGGDASVSFTWKLVGTSHTLKAVADDNNDVTESNETNNEGLAFM